MPCLGPLSFYPSFELELGSGAIAAAAGLSLSATLQLEWRLRREAVRRPLWRARAAGDNTSSVFPVQPITRSNASAAGVVEESSLAYNYCGVSVPRFTLIFTGSKSNPWIHPKGTPCSELESFKLNKI